MIPSHAQGSPHRLRFQRQVHALPAHDERPRDGPRGAAEKARRSIGISKVPDARLDRLTAMYNPRKRVPATVEFTDIAAAGRTGGAQALVDVAGYKNADALVHVAPRVSRPGRPASRGLDRSGARRAGDGRRADPRRPRRGRAAPRAAREGSQEEHDAELERERDVIVRVQGGARRRAAAARARSAGRRSQAAARLSVSLGEAAADRHQSRRVAARRDGERSTRAAGGAPGLTSFLSRAATAAVAVCAKIELEIAQLEAADAAAFLADLGLNESGLDRVIRASYDLLGYISFFTVGEDECRAWSIPRGTSAQRRGRRDPQRHRARLHPRRGRRLRSR